MGEKHRIMKNIIKALISLKSLRLKGLDNER